MAIPTEIPIDILFIATPIAAPTPVPIAIPKPIGLICSFCFLFIFVFHSSLKYWILTERIIFIFRTNLLKIYILGQVY